MKNFKVFKRGYYKHCKIWLKSASLLFAQVVVKYSLGTFSIWKIVLRV